MQRTESYRGVSSPASEGVDTASSCHQGVLPPAFSELGSSQVWSAATRSGGFSLRQAILPVCSARLKRFSSGLSKKPHWQTATGLAVPPFGNLEMRSPIFNSHWN